MLVLFIAIAPRLALALVWPGLPPDGLQYLRVADNVILNGCISLSNPESGDCVPHWGGNHPPGYPLMIAVSRLLSSTVMAPLIMQSLLVGFAIAYLANAVAACSRHRWIGFAAGVVLAVSPLHLAWSRLVLPEALATASTMLVAAEILLSLHQQRFRAIPISLALIVAFFVRYDGVLLVAPVAAAGFVIHRPGEALRRGAICAVIFALPIVAWSARNVDKGLSLVPDPFLQDGGRSPAGYLSWANTWIVTTYEGAGAAYPLQNRAYDEIRINEGRAFDDAGEAAKVRELLNKLEDKWLGEPFPRSIDDQFAAIAAERRTAHPIRHYVILPLRRAIEFWANPYYSFAWPLELDSRLTSADRAALSDGFRGLLHVASEYPAIVAGKGFTFAYRVFLAILVLIMIFRVRVTYHPLSVFAFLALGYAALRTLVLSYQLSIESRYIVEAAALVEVAAVGLVALFMARPGPQQVPKPQDKER